MNRKLKIASASAELMPYSQTGGLATVANSLPRAFAKLGHDVLLATPFYGQLIDPKKFQLQYVFKDIPISVSRAKKIKVNFLKGELKDNLPVYFVENEKYFSRHKNIYGSHHENARFMLFDLAVLKLLSLLEFEADVIQCHDWHAGLIPYFLSKGYYREGALKKTLCVYTINNLAFQFGRDWWTIDNDLKDDGRSALPDFFDEKIEYVNFAKRGILNADLINTVSEQYKNEILTKGFGEDLHRILQNREKRLYGIVNGIDYEDYNPMTDPGLARNYDIDKLYRKKINKVALQKYFHLGQDDKIPLIGMASRIAEQKGFDIVLNILEPVLRYPAQVIIMGDGDKKYIQALQKIQKKYPKKFVYSGWNKAKETMIYAGGDILLLPSRFEPCGLNQLISMRYGCVPVVRSIGGLADSVDNYNPDTERGNGFVFKAYDSRDFLIAVTRALDAYRYQEKWLKLISNGMAESFSWEIPAKKYIALFKKFLKKKK